MLKTREYCAQPPEDVHQKHHGLSLNYFLGTTLKISTQVNRRKNPGKTTLEKPQRKREDEQEEDEEDEEDEERDRKKI